MGRGARVLSLIGVTLAMFVALPASGSVRRIAVAVIAPSAMVEALRASAARAFSAGQELLPIAPTLAADAELVEQRVALLAAKGDALVIVRTADAGPDIELMVRVLVADRSVDRRSVVTAEQVLLQTELLVTACLAEASAAPAETAAPPETAPEPAAIAAPFAVEPARVPSRRSNRRVHPYGLLLAGSLGFLLPYLATVGVSAHYADYNPNASRAGYIPVAGPFLARARMSDKDLADGFSPGLLVDGVLQAATFGMLVSGLLWCAIGERPAAHGERVARPLLFLTPHQASAGVQVLF